MRLAVLLLVACSSRTPDPRCHERTAAMAASLAAVRAAHSPVAALAGVELVEQAGKPAPADGFILAVSESVARLADSERFEALRQQLAMRKPDQPILVAIDRRVPWNAAATAMDVVRMSGESEVHLLFSRPAPAVPGATTWVAASPSLATMLAGCRPATEAAASVASHEGDALGRFLRELPAALEKCGCSADVEAVERLLAGALAGSGVSQDEVTFRMPRAMAGDLGDVQVFHAPPPDQPWSEASRAIVSAAADPRPLVPEPRPPEPPPRRD